MITEYEITGVPIRRRLNTRFNNTMSEVHNWIAFLPHFVRTTDSLFPNPFQKYPILFHVPKDDYFLGQASQHVP